jgi:putative aminopeptidase FrvX
MQDSETLSPLHSASIDPLPLTVHAFFMTRAALLELTESILSCPTAPTFEHAVRARLLELLEPLSGVTTQIDAVGNLIAEYRGTDRPPEFTLVAHMDHPGWRLQPEREFLGSVPAELLDQAGVRPFGDFGMWDLPPFEFRDDRIYSRACDDLIGCVAIVATLQELSFANIRSSLSAVFTRAEEVGLVGAVHLARSGMLPAGIVPISLETSSELPPAKMGEGVIVRVGDQSSVFDPDITARLVRLAQAQSIRYQRCLMPGGTCEATAFNLFGYRAGALCIALGNYHNCTSDGRIDSEYVSVTDLEGLITFCVALSRHAQGATDVRDEQRSRFERRLAEYPLTR